MLKSRQPTSPEPPPIDDETARDIADIIDKLAKADGGYVHSALRLSIAAEVVEYFRLKPAPASLSEGDALLRQWLKIADKGLFRDGVGLSLAMHPIADDTRMFLSRGPVERVVGGEPHWTGRCSRCGETFDGGNRNQPAAHVHSSCHRITKDPGIITYTTLRGMRDGGEDGPCASATLRPATPQQASGDPAVDRQPVDECMCPACHDTGKDSEHMHCRLCDGDGVTSAVYDAYICGREHAEWEAEAKAESDPAPKPSPVQDEAARLRDALDSLVTAVRCEVDNKGGSGYLLARLSDAVAALRNTAALANPPAKPRRDLEEDALIKLLWSGKATANDQQWAANWIRKLMGCEKLPIADEPEGGRPSEDEIMGPLMDGLASVADDCGLETTPPKGERK